MKQSITLKNKLAICIYLILFYLFFAKNVQENIRLYALSLTIIQKIYPLAY